MTPAKHQSNQLCNAPREGKTLVLIAIALPMIFGMVGLVIDGGLLMDEHRGLQTVADAAATTAAFELSQGKSLSDARQAATELVNQQNQLADVTVTVNHPPTQGPYAGNANYVEVTLSRVVESHFIHVLNDQPTQTVRTRAVAGVENATSGGVVMILDPDPSPVTITGLPLGIPSVSVPNDHLAGLEVLGLGTLQVDGAVLVNTNWGGEDENGDPAGEEPNLGLLRHAITCTPLLPLTKLRAESIHVTGGVGNRKNYGHTQSGEPNPLKANKSAVADPLENLPAPTLANDPLNVSATECGHVNVVSVPLLAPPIHLHPGIYESINITSGRVIFEPGVYIIRNKHPVLQTALSIIAGQVTADGVLFYITNSSGYSPSNGLPDANDGGTTPPGPGVASMKPSVILNAGLLTCRFRGLNSPGSPFHEMLIYQRKTDRRPIVISAISLAGNPDIRGTVYAKWGQLLFDGRGTFDLKFAVGTACIVNAISTTLNRTTRFPAVREVSLVE